MEQITARTLRNVEWKQVYNYEGTPGKGFRSYGFTVYASDALPGLTITKERRGMKRVKTTTLYKFDGRKTDSPTQVVKYYNEKARKAKADGGRPAAGSLKSTGRPRGDAGV